MANAIEVATEKALIDRLIAYATSPDVQVSVPNVSFTMPQAGQNVWWLRGTFLPAETFALGVSYTATNQHYGIFQIDVFFGEESGEYAPGRIATDLIAWFKRGTKLTQDGFKVEMIRPPWRSRLIKDSPWVIIPVNVPYIAFAPNPA